MQLEKQKKIRLSELISFVLENIDDIDDSFCMYASEYLDQISSTMTVYIDEYPNEDEEGEDLYSSFVIENELELIYYGEQFVDVIRNALHQNSKIDKEELIKALNYFMDNDNFITY